MESGMEERHSGTKSWKEIHILFNYNKVNVQINSLQSSIPLGYSSSSSKVNFMALRVKIWHQKCVRGQFEGHFGGHKPSIKSFLKALKSLPGNRCNAVFTESYGLTSVVVNDPRSYGAHRSRTERNSTNWQEYSLISSRCSPLIFRNTRICTWSPICFVKWFFNTCYATA